MCDAMKMCRIWSMELTNYNDAPLVLVLKGVHPPISVSNQASARANNHFFHHCQNNFFVVISLCTSCSSRVSTRRNYILTIVPHTKMLTSLIVMKQEGNVLQLQLVPMKDTMKGIKPEELQTILISNQLKSFLISSKAL